jgi:hypothetical protein
MSSLSSLQTSLNSSVTQRASQVSSTVQALKQQYAASLSIDSNSNFTLSDYTTYTSALQTKEQASKGLGATNKTKRTALQSLGSYMVNPPPTSLSVSSTTSDSITIAFTNPANTTSNTVTAVPTSGSTVTATFTTGSPYVITGLASAKAYTISLTATTSNGVTSSVTVSGTTADAANTVYTPSSFGAYSTVNSALGFGAGSYHLCNNSQRLVIGATGVWFSTDPFTSAPTQFYSTGACYACTVPDGSRGVFAVQNGQLYTFSWTGSTYSNVTLISASVAKRFQGQISMTSDGSRVVVIADKVYWMGGWNGSTYTTWNTTLDTSTELSQSSANWGVGVSPDGSKIVYATSGKTMRYAVWNGSNYTSGATLGNIPTATGGGFSPTFHPSGTVVFMAFGGFNLPYMYAVWNPATNSFGSAVTISTSSIPIGVSGFTLGVANDGSFLFTGGYGQKIYKTAVTYTSQTVQATKSTGSTVFNGTNQSGVLSSASIYALSSGTIECWVKTTYSGGNWQSLVVKQNAFGLSLLNGRPAVWDWSNSTYQQASSGTVNNGSWNHVALVFQSGVTGGSKFYVNGTLVLSFTYTVANQTQALSVAAASAGTGQYFQGQMDEIRIWNTALSGTTIASNYNKRLPTSTSNLVGYWYCEEAPNMVNQINSSYNFNTSNSPTFSSEAPFITLS